MAPRDPTSLEESWISDAGRRFQADEEASADLANTRRLDDIEPAGYAGVFLVGGTAPTWDFPGNAKLAALVEGFAHEQKVVGAVCHGVIGLDRKSVGVGKSVTVRVDRGGRRSI